MFANCFQLDMFCLLGRLGNALFCWHKSLIIQSYRYIDGHFLWTFMEENLFQKAGDITSFNATYVGIYRNNYSRSALCFTSLTGTLGVG